MPSQERGTPKRKTFVSQTGSNGCAQDGSFEIKDPIHIYEYIHIYVYVHTRPYIYTSTHIDVCVYVFWGFLQARVTLRHCAPQARGLAHCRYGTTLGRPRTISQSLGLTLLPFSPIKVFPVACRLVNSITESFSRIHGTWSNGKTETGECYEQITCEE